MADLSQISNEELMQIAGQGKSDLSGLSSDELFSLAGIERKPTFISEVVAPFTHAASTFASDIPKAIGSRDTSEAGRLAYEELYPEQQTFGGKALRFGLSVPAFVVGAPGKAVQLASQGLRQGARFGTKFIPEVVGKATAGRMALRAGEFGAGTAAIAPKEGEDYGESIRNAAMTGAFVPPAGLVVKGAGKNLVKSGKFVAKTFGGITDFSRDTIKRLGSEKVFDPLKQNASYVGDVVVPKAKARISGIVTEAKNHPAMRNMGLTDDEIKGLKGINPNYKSKLSEVLNGDEVNIKNGISEIEADAKNRFAAVMSKVNPNTAIDVKNFYFKLKSTLINQGWLGKTGEPVEKVGKNQVRDQLLSIYGYLNKTIKQPGGYRKNIIDVREYENLRSSLDLVTGTKDDRLMFELGGKIRDEAAKVIKGLPEINKLYADAMKLGEIEKRGILTKIMSKERLEKELFNLKNIDRPNQVSRIKSIIGDDLYDDVAAHLAVGDLGLVPIRPGAGGGLFPGQSGVKKAFLAEGAKKYYKDIYPFTQKVKGGYEKLRIGAEEAYQKPAFGSFISPKTSKKLLNKGGFVDYGKFSGGKVKPLTAAEAVKQGMGAEEWIASKKIEILRKSEDIGVFSKPEFFDIGKKGISSEIEFPSKNRPLLQRRDYGSLVYRDPEGKPQGVLTFKLRKDGSLETNPEFGANIEIFVSPKYRKQGIATKLYEKAKSLGFDFESVKERVFTKEGAEFRKSQLLSEYEAAKGQLRNKSGKFGKFIK